MWRLRQELPGCLGLKLPRSGRKSRGLAGHRTQLAIRCVDLVPNRVLRTVLWAAVALAVGEELALVYYLNSWLTMPLL